MEKSLDNVIEEYNKTHENDGDEDLNFSSSGASSGSNENQVQQIIKILNNHQDSLMLLDTQTKTLEFELNKILKNL